jgi:O-Antigen ligase
MKLNIYLATAILYFFFNSAGLPFGLTYMALLAPVWYIWILLKRKKEILLPFFTCLLPFCIAHIFFIRVDMKEYLVTLGNITAVYIFGQAFYTWLKRDTQKEKIFRVLLIINIAFCLLAVISYFTPLSAIFWIRQNITANVEDFLRLKMFTYEASYYALVFTPLFFFFLMQFVLNKNTMSGPWLLLFIFIPIILSFSIGVILCLLLSGLLTFIIHYRTLHTKRRVVNGAITLGVSLIVVSMIVFVFFPGNPVVLRLENILAGKDTSTMGRTAEAFELALNILNVNNPYWGIGPGQLNIAGADMIRSYYLYYFTTPVAIPNAAAETLVLFGWIGLVLRLGIQVFLFLVTGVWKNYYRLLLFLFMFIYQFTGSYITNIAEYVIWILAFTNTFPVFNAERPEKRSKA